MWTALLGLCWFEFAFTPAIKLFRYWKCQSGISLLLTIMPQVSCLAVNEAFYSENLMWLVCRRVERLSISFYIMKIIVLEMKSTTSEKMVYVHDSFGLNALQTWTTAPWLLLGSGYTLNPPLTTPIWSRSLDFWVWSKPKSSGIEWLGKWTNQLSRVAVEIAMHNWNLQARKHQCFLPSVNICLYFRLAGGCSSNSKV